MLEHIELNFTEIIARAIAAQEEAQKAALSPCPFCGGEAHVRKHGFYDENGYYGVACKKCGAQTCQYFATEADAMNAWNGRAR